MSLRDDVNRGAVAAGLLGQVERAVGAGDEFVRRLGRRPGGDAGRERLARGRDGPQPLDERFGAIGVRAREEDDELLAAVARDLVDGPQRASPGRGRAAQQSVSGLMTELVVEALEAI